MVAKKKPFKRSTPLPAKEAREAWLLRATNAMRRYFSKHSYTIPENVRLSCGWPSTGALAKRKRRIGEAWASTASKDQHFEIFISPVLDDPIDVLSTLMHELIHVTVGLECGHKGPFSKAARDLGLEGRMTATVASVPLNGDLETMANDLGDYPHASLEQMTNGRKKQKTRLIKAECSWCKYTIRASLMWLSLGVPNCPNPMCQNHNQPLLVDMPDLNEEAETVKTEPFPDDALETE